jgi:hypothetical protein
MYRVIVLGHLLMVIYTGANNDPIEAQGADFPITYNHEQIDAQGLIHYYLLYFL